MFGLTQKQLEKIATKCSILIGIGISIFGILLLVDGLLGFDFFPDRVEKIGAVLIGIASIILAVAIFISVMLNISRVANSMENIANKLER